MKKKATRLLVSVCVVAMLISCLAVSAFADDTVQYTIKAGDTVLAVCNSLGVDFYANQDWITAVNHITNYRDIKVGKVLTLPLFNTKTNPTLANSLLASLTGATSVSTGGTTVPATTTTTTTTAVAAHAGDSIVSYLVNHVMQPGETVYSVCNALGVNFNANADKIMKLSGITSWNRVAVGKTVVIPTTTAPAGSSYTAIVAHKVTAGETVGSICNSYGINYAKSIDQLKALNSTDNLNVIKVGQTFYLPVAGTALTTTTTTGTITGGTATTITPSTQTSTVKETSAPHGSFKLQINGQDVTSAAAGQVVTIVASPEPGYKVKDVTIMKVGGGDYVVPTGMTFVMPNYQVSVNVTFELA